MTKSDKDDFLRLLVSAVLAVLFTCWLYHCKENRTPKEEDKPIYEFTVIDMWQDTKGFGKTAYNVKVSVTTIKKVKDTDTPPISPQTKRVDGSWYRELKLGHKWRGNYSWFGMYNHR